VTVRELNRSLLARQLLLDRRRVPMRAAVRRLVALQAQWAPSPYVALWSRLPGFRKEQLSRALADGTVLKGAVFRTTLHVVDSDLFPAVAASYLESERVRTENLAVDLGKLRAAIPAGPVEPGALEQLARQVLGTDDRWTISFALRAVPLVRAGIVGAWPHTKSGGSTLWLDPLPEPQEAANAVVRAYLAAYGPAAREDIQQFTGFRLGQIDPALDALRKAGDGLWDVPRAQRVERGVRAPVRFLPAFDSIILAHRDRSRIVPPEYIEAVFNKRNATTKNTFTVDGFVAGAWKLEGKRLRIEPFAPLPARARREVDAEGERLLAWYLA
jgi:hypothetical protein